MKGLVMARMVLMNQDGCTIINDFKFFLSLQETSHTFSLCCHYFFSPPFIFCQREQMFLGHDIICAGMMVGPSVDHLVAFLQPAQARHSSVGCGAVQVDYHVVLRHHQLQGADHIAAETQRPKSHE